MVGVVPAAVTVVRLRLVQGRMRSTRVAARRLIRVLVQRTVMTTTARQRVRPVLPGRRTRPHVARRARVPGGARSSDRLGRTSGSRDSLHPGMALRRRLADRADAFAFVSNPHPHATSFRPLVAKTTAPTFVATKWRVCPFCFLGWHHRNGSKAVRVAPLGNSESGGLASNKCSWNVWDKGNHLPMCEIAGSGIAWSK